VEQTYISLTQKFESLIFIIRKFRDFFLIALDPSSN
jgi:hypothetical protein